MKKQDFTLLKVKVLNRGVFVEYQAKLADESIRTHSINGKEQPHEDLAKAIKGITAQLAEVFYMTDQSIIDKLKVTGISLKGALVTILGTLTVPNGRVVAINSGVINLEADIYGFEQILCDIVDIIEDESFAYAIENKNGGIGQPELPFEQEEEVDELEDGELPL